MLKGVELGTVGRWVRVLEGGRRDQKTVAEMMNIRNALLQTVIGQIHTCIVKGVALSSLLSISSRFLFWDGLSILLVMWCALLEMDMLGAQ